MLSAGLKANGDIQTINVTDTGEQKVSIVAGTAILGKVAIDQATADANKVVTKTGSVTSATLVNQGKQASATITLDAAADAHDALDVISTAAGAILSFTSLGAANDLICILGARMKYNVNAVPPASTGYRLHLYNESPTAIADDAAFNVIAADLAKYIGFINISTLTDVGDNCVSADDNINFTCKLVGTGLYGQLQCIAAETPAASAVFTILLNTVAV